MKYLIRLGESEILRTGTKPEFSRLAIYYHNRLKRQLEQIRTPGFSIVQSLKELEASGHLKLITTAATHAFLPLMLQHPEAIKAQLHTGIAVFEKIFGHKPDGIWLPECAYYYNLDLMLQELGVHYFISENITVLNSLPGSVYGTFTPVATPSGIAVFPRDAEASRQVWSNTCGYPASGCYREFYRDIGYDLPLDYIYEYMEQKPGEKSSHSRTRQDTGFKYYSITDRLTDQKQVYNRDAARRMASEHGRDFARSRCDQITQLLPVMDATPIITCPFDTELFGHWWYEGPEFLEAFIREAAQYAQTYTLVSPSDYLAQNTSLQCVAAAPGSWGENGDFSLWLNSSNDWIILELYQCRELLVQQAGKHALLKNDTSGMLLKRALNQCVRELMLAEASDWQFLISKNTSAAYAVSRVTTHISNFKALMSGVAFAGHSIDENLLQRLEQTNNLFPEMDYRFYMQEPKCK